MRLPQFIETSLAWFKTTDARLTQLEQKKADTAPPPDPDNDGDEHCDACAGSGKCDACEGAGAMDGNKCADCDGSGKCAECEGKGTASAQVSALKASLATTDKLVAGLMKQLGEQKVLLDSKAAQITKLEADLASEKKRSNEVLASQGLPPGQLPAAVPTTPTGANAESAWDKYNRLLGEGKAREAGEFWTNNAKEILASRK